MKLIDEKGRLFGKINLIDLLVVLLIVAVLAAVVWKLCGRKAARSSSSLGFSSLSLLLYSSNSIIAYFSDIPYGTCIVYPKPWNL